MRPSPTVLPPQGALTEHTRIAIVTAEALLPCRFTPALDRGTARGPGRGCGLDGGLGNIGSPFFSVFLSIYYFFSLSIGSMGPSVVDLLQFNEIHLTKPCSVFFCSDFPLKHKCCTARRTNRKPSRLDGGLGHIGSSSFSVFYTLLV